MTTTSPAVEGRWIARTVSLVFCCALLAWGYEAWTTYERQQTSYEIWGNAHMAFNDAAVWLRGGLRFFFGMNAEPNLYRPTIGVIYASLIALTGTTTAIALFPVGLFLIAFPVSFLSRGQETRPLVLAFLLILTLFYGALFGPLLVSIGTMMTEAMVWAFTLVAYLLIASSIATDGVTALPAVVGFVFLGMATAVRGLQLGGGLAVLCGLVVWFHRRESKAKLVALFLAFAGPVLLDAVLQKAYGIRGNALQLVYVFVQPPHTWVQQTHWDFLRSKIPDSAVLGMFFHFMLRSDGIVVLLRLMAESARAHLASVSPFGLFLLACALTGLGMERWRSQWRTILMATVNLLVILVAPRAGAIGAAILFGWLFAVAVISLRRRMSFTFVAIALYLGSLALFIVTCSPGEMRTAATFVGTLYFALVAFGWEIHRAREVDVASPWTLKALSVGLGGVIVCLYVGCLVARHPVQAVFRTQVLGRDAALKVAGDPRIDRALYINGDGVTFYTRSDDRLPGSVVRYKSLAMGPVPKFLSDDPGYEPMQIILMTSVLEPIAFVPLVD